ncbi:MAG: hypothetical protein HKM94_03185 [Halobacteria archaeon]|nr:hypothetical protein [Halobacteria archaeon]
MNNKTKLPALLLAAVTTIGFMLPQTAAARDRHADDRGSPPKFAHYDRERHQYRQQRQHYRHHQHRSAPRWYRRYQRHYGYGHHYRPWRKHPGYFMDRHALKKHYRRMERQQRHHRRYDRSPYGGYNDSNIHFRIDYWN